jgi:hypothetical protein
VHEFIRSILEKRDSAIDAELSANWTKNLFSPGITLVLLISILLKNIQEKYCEA